MRTIAIVGRGKISNATKDPSIPDPIDQGIIGEAKKFGFQTATFRVSDLSDDFFKKVSKENYCGLLIFATTIQSDPRLIDLKKKGISIIVDGCTPGKIGFDSVMPNHQAGCYDLTRYFIEKGCHRILRCWSIPEPIIRANPAGIHWLAHRNLGYEQAVRETQIEFLPALEIILPLTNNPPITKEVFDLRVKIVSEHLKPYLHSSNPIDGILASNDINSFEIAAACRKLGVIPNRDIPIAGYDNYWHHSYKREWENFIPFATIDKQDQKIGANMVNVLIKRMEKKLGPNLVDMQIPPKFIIPSQNDPTTV